MHPQNSEYRYWRPFSGNAATSVAIRPPLKRAWSLKTPGRICSIVGVGERVFIAYGLRGLMAVDVASGRVLWDHLEGPDRDESSDVWLIGERLFVRDHYAVSVLDTETGQAADGSFVFSKIVGILPDGRILVSRNTGLNAVDPADPASALELIVPGASTALTGTKLCFAMGPEHEGPECQAVDPVTRKALYKFDGQFPRAAADGFVLNCHPNRPGATNQINFISLADEASGANLWTIPYEKGAHIAFPYQIAISKVRGCLVFNKGGWIECVELQSGKRRWQARLGIEFWWMFVSEGLLWVSVGNLQGKRRLFAIDLDTGEVVWERANPLQLATPVGNSIIMSGTRNIQCLAPKS